MYTDYRAFYEKYRTVYGDNTAIFLQVGSFYELYDSINPLSGESTCNCREIVDHLGIQLTIRKGDGEAGHDGLFAGIPDHSLHKWAGRLTAAGWTVVVVDQVKDGAGRVQRREVARILSPGTHIEAATSDAGATIAAIWLEAGASAAHAPLSYGAAVLDLTTGITHTTAGQTKGEASSWTSDTLVQFLQIYSPRELLILWRGDALLIPDEALLRRRLGMPTGLIHVRLAGPDYQGSLEIDMVREEFLRATYGIKSLLPTREWLRLGQGQCPHGLAQERALVCLLRFVEDHFPSALTQLQLNRPWMPRAALTLGNHALTQLQIVAPRLQDSVLGLFRSCITPMGKRAMRERLLSPSADAAVIEARLAEVDQYISDILQPAGKQDGILSSLRSIYDLPRLHRRIACGTVSAADVLALDQSYRVAIMLGRTGLPARLDAPQGLLADLVGWRAAAFDKYISVEKAGRASEDCSFLVASEAQFPRIAAAEARLAEIRTIVERFAELCCTVTGRSAGFKVEEKEKQAYGIRGTKVALQALQGHLRSAADVATVVESLRGATTVTSGANGGWVEVPWLTALSAEAARLRAQLAADVARELPQVCAALVAEAPWITLEEWLERLDVTQCIARESVTRGYVRPQIIAAAPAASLDARGLRHPLIETILTRTEYVQHNVSIGASPEARSWLVYGMNASGKSSLMKSIGIAVHLAQAGCYVPAASFAIAPFTSIYTRILNQDNLWAGLSSFAVEMAEMRDILDAADSRTLVLGDELCSGTESVSAQALVAAGIEWLSEAGARFVFATHLHGLLDVLPAPSQLGLQVWHLKVAYDAVKDRLVYERTLKPGAGSTLYGIEVARAMHLPVQFIEVAHRYRRRLQGTVSYEEAAGSSWNGAVARRCCEVCGAGIVSDLEVHHIRPRAEAAAGTTRFADGAGRDDVRNLIVVCAKCHDEAHAGRQEIGLLVQTSDGPVRGGADTVASTGTTSSVDSAATRASKWEPAEQGIILNMLRINQIVPLKIIAFRLKEEHDIDISEATLRRIRKSGSF